MSSAPPRPSATTGVPAASASTIVIPKSSSPTWRKPEARSYSRASSSRESQPTSSTFSGRDARSVSAERADADHRQPVRKPAKGLDHGGRILVGHEPVRPEEAAGLLLRVRVEVGDIDGRRHDDRVTSVEAPDALGDRGRVGHVDVGPLRRLEILLAQPAGEELRAVVRPGHPRVADRRVAVADVQRVLARPCLHGEGVRRGDDDVVGVQVEVREVARHERREEAPVPGVVPALAQAGQAREARLLDDRRGELGRQQLLLRVEREDVRLLEEPRAHRLDDALRSVEALEPVVDDRGVHSR